MQTVNKHEHFYSPRVGLSEQQNFGLTELEYNIVFPLNVNKP
jgi:hypothetical protein